MFEQTVGVLTGVPPVTLQLWLTTAQAAYAQLVTGGKPVSVSYAQGSTSRSVTYSAADRLQLEQWITQLQRALGMPAVRRRPVTPWFR